MQHRVLRTVPADCSRHQQRLLLLLLMMWMLLSQRHQQEAGPLVCLMPPLQAVLSSWAWMRLSLRLLLLMS